MEVGSDGGSLAKFATEPLTEAAARIESHPVGTDGNDGGDVVQFPTNFLRTTKIKTAPIAGGRLNTGGLSQIRTVDLRIKSPLLYQLS